MLLHSKPLGGWVCAWTSPGLGIWRQENHSSRGGQTVDARDWLHRSIRYNKPLIWWSIWSRTSSSIIHSSPLVTSATQRLPGSQTAWAPRCTCVTQRLCIHQPVCLRPVAPRTRDSSPKVVTIRPRTAEVVCFYLTFKARDKASQCSCFLSWIDFCYPSSLLFLCGCFLALCYFCPHVLCISLHAIPFKCLLFVPLSSSLITAILSL